MRNWPNHSEHQLQPDITLLIQTTLAQHPLHKTKEDCIQMHAHTLTSISLKHRLFSISKESSDLMDVSLYDYHRFDSRNQLTYYILQRNATQRIHQAIENKNRICMLLLFFFQGARHYSVMIHLFNHKWNSLSKLALATFQAKWIKNQRFFRNFQYYYYFSHFRMKRQLYCCKIKIIFISFCKKKKADLIKLLQLSGFDKFDIQKIAEQNSDKKITEMKI